jgi:Fic family protein
VKGSAGGPRPVPSGAFRLIRVPGENYRAFVPRGLNASPPVSLTGADALLNDEARAALARLDGLSPFIPDANLFIYMYLRKEALLSAQIEGTQSSLSDLLLFEDEDPQDSLEDAVEVTDYIGALRFGLDRMKVLPLSTRLFNEIHARLVEHGRGRNLQPGLLRRSQNWIGGTRPGNARFVPPPASEVPDCLADLERYLNDDGSLELPLVRIARAHAQFETVHPYLDGNGRLGRLLITLGLVSFGIVEEPLLYLSLYLKEHRDLYYDLLQRTRTHGEWLEWIRFFLEGVRQTARQATETARQIVALFRKDRIALEGLRSSATLRRLHTELQRTPILSVTRAVALTGISHPTTMKGFETMESLKLVRELTGRKRGRIFEYTAYLNLLREGTDPLPERG